MNLSFLFVIRKLYFPLIIGTFLCTPVIANPQSSIVYVKTRLDITLEQLSNQLDIPSDYLADLNDCDINRKFSNNEWVAIPAKSIDSIRFVVALDDSEIRRAQPNRSIFTKAGDNLAKIASRYEVPLKELTRLNPGLNPITRLAVDTPIKLFQPLRSRNTGLIFDESLQELERESIISIKESQQLQRRERIVPNLSNLCRSDNLSKREKTKLCGQIFPFKYPTIHRNQNSQLPQKSQSNIPSKCTDNSLECALRQFDSSPTKKDLKPKSKLILPLNIYAITAERRALLNTIRYSEGSWAEGGDIGYYFDTGAYNIPKEKWRSILLKGGFSFEQAQDQAALAIIHKLSALPLSDEGIFTTKLSNKLAKFWPSFKGKSDDRVNSAGIIIDKTRFKELNSFYNANLSHLRGAALATLPTRYKPMGICSDLSTHEIEVDSSPNPSIQRLMALQRRNASRDACNVEKAESNRLIQAERIADMRRNRLNWKTYGDVQIPWGLWFEPLAGKRVNGFLSSSFGTNLGQLSVESNGPTGAPNGISVSCSTGTFSKNTNPNWNRVQSGWTEWAPPPKGSDWERIVIDLCSPVVNR